MSWPWLLLPVVVCVSALAIARAFIWPTSDDVGRADAVVALAGAPERTRLALRLVGEGVAAELVLSRPDGIDTHGGPPCGSTLPGGAIVRCVDPSPPTTSGEAAALGRLAADRGWSSIVVVTNRAHMPRARLLLGQCFDGRIQMVNAGFVGGSRRRVLLDVLEEMRNYVAALTIDRAC